MNKKYRPAEHTMVMKDDEALRPTLFIAHGQELDLRIVLLLLQNRSTTYLDIAER